mmetsp:Transcript_15568/g.33101  ORF Transcript_15568/g.33101 Transcript_15568/m.33101 type:complete len:441 (-) Transcript_15568:277-1599(-)
MIVVRDLNVLDRMIVRSPLSDGKHPPVGFDSLTSLGRGLVRQLSCFFSPLTGLSAHAQTSISPLLQPRIFLGPSLFGLLLLDRIQTTFQRQIQLHGNFLFPEDFPSHPSAVHRGFHDIHIRPVRNDQIPRNDRGTRIQHIISPGLLPVFLILIHFRHSVQYPRPSPLVVMMTLLTVRIVRMDAAGIVVVVFDFQALFDDFAFDDLGSAMDIRRDDQTGRGAAYFVNSEGSRPSVMIPRQCRLGRFRYDRGRSGGDVGLELQEGRGGEGHELLSRDGASFGEGGGGEGVGFEVVGGCVGCGSRGGFGFGAVAWLRLVGGGGGFVFVAAGGCVVVVVVVGDGFGAGFVDVAGFVFRFKGRRHHCSDVAGSRCRGREGRTVRAVTGFGCVLVFLFGMFLLFLMIMMIAFVGGFTALSIVLFGRGRQRRFTVSLLLFALLSFVR